MQSILELSGKHIGSRIAVVDLARGVLRVTGVLQDISYELSWVNLLQERFGRASVTSVVVLINDSYLHLNTTAQFEVLDN